MAITAATIIQILKRAAIWLILFPAVLAGTVSYMTRDMPLEFTSTSTVYTGIASGYSITSSENDRIDNTAVNNAFDNLMTTIKSRETLTEVGVHLLAHHLSIKNPRPDQLSAKSAKALKAMMNPVLKKATVPGDENATYQRLQTLLQQPGGNTLQSLLYQSSTPYSVESIQGRISSARKGSSDMLDLSSKGSDPAICQQTLTYLIESFKHRYTAFKTSETGSVVEYFDDQTKTAFKNLKLAEDRLTKYSIENKIINYPEQSKFTAAAKEGLTTEYYQEKRTLETANSALNTLKLDDRAALVAASEGVTTKRAELAKAQTQLSNATMYGFSKDSVTALRATINQLSEELKGMVQQYYGRANTMGAVPRKDLVSVYLQNTLENKGSAARMKTMEERIREFDQVYDVMAPQGSAVGRLQREIGVAEKEYLSALHSLNIARVRQKDLEMSGAMAVLDPPSLPMKPLPSSRRMMIIAACLAGVVLVVSVSLAKVMLNDTIASPERVEPLINIPLAAAMPLRLPRLAQYDLDYVEHCMLEQLLSRILVDTQQAKTATASYRLITIFSTSPHQGKSWVGSRISDLFAETGNRVAYLYADKLLNPDPAPSPSPGPIPTQAQPIAYPLMTDFANGDRLTELLNSIPELATSSFDYVFLELPALLNTPMPVKLINQSDMSLLVVSARSKWNRSDQELCTLYQRAASGPIVAVLNDVEPERLEMLMGPLAKKRPWLERIKKMRPGKKDKASQELVKRM